MRRLGEWRQAAVRRLGRYAEWVFVVVTLVVSFGATRQGPDADPDAFIVATFGLASLMIAFYFLWMIRPRRTDAARTKAGEARRRRDVPGPESKTGRGRRSWIAWVGIPAAVLVVALPDILAGKLNDERTGTAASVGLFALLLFVAVLVGLAVGACVLLPLGWILRTAVLAMAGKSDEAPLIILAAFPLVIAAFAVSGAIALDTSPLADSTSVFNTNAVTVLGAEGFAGLLRAFGVHNGVRIADQTALAWFRVLAVVVGLYFVGIFAVVASAGRDQARDARHTRPVVLEKKAR